jgi:Raf kinase inhibitor-like YbhB/YbcL family protein
MIIIRFLVFAFVILIKQSTLTVKCPAFANNNFIPDKYTCNGENVNPPLIIEGIPAGAKSLALIIDDPDSPNGPFDHCVAWNIPPDSQITENNIPGIIGKNTAGQNRYYGPCPPNGIHEYHFRVFALDATLDIPGSSGKSELQKAMASHIIASGEITGRFQK